MSDVKTRYANEKIFDLIIEECADFSNDQIIKSIEKVRAKIIDLGEIHARRA